VYSTSAHHFPWKAFERKVGKEIQVEDEYIQLRNKFEKQRTNNNNNNNNVDSDNSNGETKKKNSVESAAQDLRKYVCRRLQECWDELTVEEKEPYLTISWEYVLSFFLSFFLSFLSIKFDSIFFHCLSSSKFLI